MCFTTYCSNISPNRSCSETGPYEKCRKKKKTRSSKTLNCIPEPIYGEDLGTKNVSKLLVEARQSLNLSQKEIADQLYLTKTLIQQLEEGEFGEPSTKAFVKGYLRSYARVVGLSADDLIQRFEEEQKEKTSVLEPTLPLAKKFRSRFFINHRPCGKDSSIRH